jgi:hypothetical protein
MGANHRFVATRLLGFALIGGCALLTICPTRTINGAEAAEAQTANAGEPAKKDLSPAALLGLDEQQTTDLLGTATTIESRPPANIWHYKGSRCELELAFYMEMRSGRMRTLDHAFKNRAGTAAQAEACLTAIVQERLKGSPSDALPETSMTAEAAMVNEVHAAPVGSLVDNDIPPEPQPRPQAARPKPHAQRGYTRYRPRWIPAQGEWDFTFALRNYSGQPAADAAITTGWGGGRFGPTPYSSTGQ